MTTTTNNTSHDNDGIKISTLRQDIEMEGEDVGKRGRGSDTTSTKLSDADDTNVIEEPPEKKKSCCTDQMNKIHITADYWSLWIGLLSFGLAMVLVFTVPYDKDSTRSKNVIPGPMTWESNPLDAWDLYTLIGTLLLLAYFCILYLVALWCIGKLEKNPAIQHTKGFFLMGIIATLSLWLGRNRWCATNGLSYAIFSIIFGMIVTNTPVGQYLPSLKLASEDGEFFIKCSLALLATEFSVLAKVGLPAIVVAWVGSPIALVSGYIVGKKVLKMETDIALLTAVGATWYVAAHVCLCLNSCGH